MTVEYDLIAIGGSTAGIQAAVAATYLKARVALVEPQGSQTDWMKHGAMYAQALAQVGRAAKHVQKAPELGIHVSSTDSTPEQLTPSIRVTQAMQWAEAVIHTSSEQVSPAILASLGVDVITGVGEFCRLPHLGFIVNNRRLRARAYLIATGSCLGIPNIEGLPTIRYLTPADVWRTDLSQRLQGSWVVIGDGPMAAELAQTLLRLKCDVTLIVEGSHILPNEDPEASGLVQAQLEAEGIRILTDSPVSLVRRIDDKTWVQAGNRAIEADELVLATAWQPNVAGLNLEGVGVKFHPQGLDLNEKLQTTNPRIYACGGVTGGYQSAHIAQYEASIALKNALFAPLFKVDYRGIPRTIFCDPQLARVGLTEAQARLRYGKDVFVVRQYFKSLDKAQLMGETTGFCKLVGRQNGEILGASIVGSDASEAIAAIALAIRHKMTVNAIANLPQVSPTFAEIVHKTALEWRRQRQNHNKTLQDFLEGFFDFRRKWSS